MPVAVGTRASIPALMSRVNTPCSGLPLGTKLDLVKSAKRNDNVRAAASAALAAAGE